MRSPPAFADGANEPKMECRLKSRLRRRRSPSERMEDMKLTSNAMSVRISRTNKSLRVPSGDLEG
eukprot:7338447-Pyramimonas_sp.AAC.1